MRAYAVAIVFTVLARTGLTAFRSQLPVTNIDPKHATADRWRGCSTEAAQRADTPWSESHYASTGWNARLASQESYRGDIAGVHWARRRCRVLKAMGLDGLPPLEKATWQSGCNRRGACLHG